MSRSGGKRGGGSRSSRGGGPRSHGGAIFARRWQGQILSRNSRHINMDINAIIQGAADFALIICPAPRRT